MKTGKITVLQFFKAVGQNTVKIDDKMARMIQENRSEKGSKQSNLDYQFESQSEGDNNKSIYKKVMNQQKEVLKMTMLTILTMKMPRSKRRRRRELKFWIALWIIMIMIFPSKG